MFGSKGLIVVGRELVPDWYDPIRAVGGVCQRIYICKITVKLNTESHGKREKQVYSRYNGQELGIYYNVHEMPSAMPLII